MTGLLSSRSHSCNEACWRCRVLCTPVPPMTDQQEESGATGAGRGFDDDELAACIKVLTALVKCPEVVKTPEYKNIRILCSDVGRVSGNSPYCGMDPKEYNSRKQRKLRAKVRRMNRAKEDARRIARTKFKLDRMARLQKLTQLDSYSVPRITNESDANGEGDASEKPIVEDLPDTPVGPWGRPEEDAGDATANAPKARVPSFAPPDEVFAQAKEEEELDSDDTSDEDRLLSTAQYCYQCKTRFWKLHHYYHLLCRSCGDKNYHWRSVTADMTDRVALVTGGRVKIGYEIALKLLRAGARCIVTSRFPNDAALRYSLEEDYDEWKHRLDIYGLDFRFLQAVEAFADFLCRTYDHLDVLINNAAQTVRRPIKYYEHLIENESKPLAALPASVTPVLEKNAGVAFHAVSSTFPSLLDADLGTGSHLPAPASTPGLDDVDDVGKADTSVPLEAMDDELRSHAVHAGTPEAVATNVPILNASAPGADDGARVPVASSSASSTRATPPLVVAKVDSQSVTAATLSQIPVTDEDRLYCDDETFPPGDLDDNHQQQDYRPVNSWIMKVHEVPMVELLENSLINSCAPFVLCSKLRPLLQACPRDLKFIVNVSSVEGMFYHYKSATHPHTNMFKAALNMMTRSTADDFLQDGIYVTAVDTGWVSQMNPHERGGHGFTIPIDEVDGAARVLQPVFEAVNGGKKWTNVILKDYGPAAW